MKRVKRYIWLVLIELGVLFMIVLNIMNNEYQPVLWLFIIGLLNVMIYSLLKCWAETLTAKTSLLKKNEELRVLIKNLSTDNAELRRKLSRKRPKPQTEGKSDE